MISGATVLSSEFIPLYHYMPGGVALALWIPICRANCVYCPWYASSSLKEVDLITVNIDRVIEIIHRVRADYVFIHGGEPLEFIEPEVLDKLCSFKVPLGAKLRIESLSNFQEILEKFDVVLIEVMLSRCSEVKRYYEIISSLSAEIILVSERGIVTNEILRCLECLESISKPIHIYLELDIKDANRIAKYGHDIGIKYLYFPLVRVADLNTTYCPKCGSIIIYREGGIILRYRVRNTKCPICGANILYRAIPTKIRTGINYAMPRELLTDT